MSMLRSCHPRRAFSNQYWIRWMIILLSCWSLCFVVFQSNVFYDWQQTKYDICHNDNAPAVATPKATKRKTFKLFQVINTFAMNKDKTNDDSGNGNGNGNPTNSYQPYDQWSTLASIQRAKKHYAARSSLMDNHNNLEITLVCAMFESDESVLVANHLVQPPCDHVSRLERSTVTEYGNGNYSNETLFSEVFSKRELPFLQDLLDVAVSVARNETTKHNTAGSITSESNNCNDEDDAEDEDFYVMLTNSDIGLTKNFFSFLLPLLEEEQKAYTINRWSIPMDGEPHPITIRTPTNDPQEIETLLTQIDASLVTGTKHPGYDCFIIHSSIIDKISLGTMYAGFPPWGSALMLVLKDIVANNTYKKVGSTPNATFHLGDRGTWSKKKSDDTSQTVLKYIKERYKEDIADCPKTIFPHDPHTVMNAANCGRVFREDYNRSKSRRNIPPKVWNTKTIKQRKQ